MRHVLEFSLTEAEITGRNWDWPFELRTRRSSRIGHSTVIRSRPTLRSAGTVKRIHSVPPRIDLFRRVARSDEVRAPVSTLARTTPMCGSTIFNRSRHPRVISGRGLRRGRGLLVPSGSVLTARFARGSSPPPRPNRLTPGIFFDELQYRRSHVDTRRTLDAL